MLVPPIASPWAEMLQPLQTGHLRCHFSQFGEDAILWTYLGGLPPQWYVDVGAHHPYRYSNTALLSLYRNWRGINIDVDARAIAEFATHRPADVNLCIAVGETDGQCEVTLFDDGAVNTLDPRSADDPRWAHLQPRKQTAPICPLRSILRQHLPPGATLGLMNIDVEGVELSVLKSNDWQAHRPAFLSVEVHGFDLGQPQNHPVFTFLRDNGYGLIGHSFLTSIYKDVRS